MTKHLPGVAIADGADSESAATATRGQGEESL
jgi:hypothetical protein